MVRYVEIAEAAGLLQGSKRVMVVGCSGGGKTTLSRKLCDRLKLPFVSMDRDFFWLAGWQERPREEQRDLIAQKVEEPSWVMDGSNPSSFELRLPRTDIVVWVRMPRWLCLLGVYRRACETYGKTRMDMADGCAEQWPDREFRSYIWNFERKHAPIFIRNFERYGSQVPVLVLKSRREVGKLLDLLGVAD